MDNGGMSQWLLGREISRTTPSRPAPANELSRWLQPPSGGNSAPQASAAALASPVQVAMPLLMPSLPPAAPPANPGAASPPPPPTLLPVPQPSVSPSSGPSGQVAASNLGSSEPLPAFLSLMGQIKYELQSNLQQLLKLNPSRREAVAQHLESLANLPAGPSYTQGNGDPAGGLRRWIDGPHSPAQSQALQTFLEEVAMVALGQALLLKTWNDRGIRRITADDLGKLNWTLAQALKPHLPVDRDGWHITRPNLYSWYNPGPSIQKEIWRAFSSWQMGTEGPGVLSQLIRMSRRRTSPTTELAGYDERFFASVWQHLPEFGFQAEAEPTGIPRRKSAFTPTLRDGSIMRGSPESLLWIGLEMQPFRLIAAELSELWWGPKAAPLWTQGSGLEAHSRNQMQFQLDSVKPSTLSRIAEIEACDLAFVVEERQIRTSGRTTESGRYREQLDALPYFKKIRTASTPMGVLQAHVALTKLRPGGLLWWAREEPLSEADGQQSLAALLDQGKLLCEWRLGDVVHHLPAANPLFPKYLYLFQRSSDMNARQSSRPVRISLHGQIRSHVEVPVLLGDALQAYPAAALGQKPGVRGQWQVLPQVSPTAQRDWAERWPDALDTQVEKTLAQLRSHGKHLATVANIRTTPAGDSKRGGAWSVVSGLQGFWVRPKHSAEGRSLETLPLPVAPKEAQGQGILLLVADAASVAPLRHWMESRWVNHWLEHHCERKGDQWLLTEQQVKFIPVPKHLMQVMGHEGNAAQLPQPTPEWTRLLEELSSKPQDCLQRLPEISSSDATGSLLKARIFVRAAQALEALNRDQGMLLSLVDADGTIRWKELLQILPRSERVSIATHPLIQLEGMLPPHLPIGRIARVKTPAPGILLTTESGFNLTLVSQEIRLLDLLDDQLKGLDHPTWNELVQFLEVPKDLDLYLGPAEDILKGYGALQSRVQSLRQCIQACLES